MKLPAGDGADDDEGLGSAGDCLGEQVIGGNQGDILLAGEEPDQRAAVLCDVIADCPAERGMTVFERVKQRAERCRRIDVEGHFAIDVGERSQMEREFNPDRRHGTSLRNCLHLDGQYFRQVFDDRDPMIA